jgi:hypothetical protein
MTGHLSQHDQPLSPTPDQPTPTADDDDQKGQTRSNESAAAKEATKESDDNPSN